jgi:hypothetical protein
MSAQSRLTSALAERIARRQVSLLRQARARADDIRREFWAGRDEFDRDEISFFIKRIELDTPFDGAEIAQLAGWKNRSSAFRAKEQGRTASISAIKYHRLRAEFPFQQAPESEGVAVGLMRALSYVRPLDDESGNWQMNREV